MRPTYEAIYEDGRLTWLGEQPRPGRHRVLITVLSEKAVQQRSLAVRQVLSETRGAWGHDQTTEEIDAAIEQMRNEWYRPDPSKPLDAHD